MILSECTAIVQRNKYGEVCLGSLHHGGQMRPDCDVDDLPTSLPPSLYHQSFPFSPSSWSCNSYFSSYSTSRDPTIGWTVSIWQHCCVAKATTLMTELFDGGGAVQWVQHNRDMIGCYQTKLQACVCFFSDFKHTNLMMIIFLNTTSFQNQEYLRFTYYQLKVNLLLLKGWMELLCCCCLPLSIRHHFIVSFMMKPHVIYSAVICMMLLGTQLWWIN